jgi:tetratricopeptide (TPR) repeat protein
MERAAFLAAWIFIAAASGPAQEAAALIAAADALYAERANPDLARQAADKYAEAARLDPASYEARWKAAKAVFYLGRIAAAGEEKRRLFSEAIGQAKEAVRLAPGGPEGHFWLGAGYAEYGQAKGVLRSLTLRDDVEREMNTVLRIDDRFGCGAAYIALGRINYKVPGLFGGSLKKSRQHLEKALEICPRETTTLLYLAETYWEMKERRLAIETLERLLALEPYADILAEAARDKAEAGRLLALYKRKVDDNENNREE